MRLIRNSPYFFPLSSQRVEYEKTNQEAEAGTVPKKVCERDRFWMEMFGKRQWCVCDPQSDERARGLEWNDHRSGNGEQSEI